MAHMQTRSGRIREHVETVVFRPRIVVFRFVEAVRNPILAPFRLDLYRVVTLTRHNLMIIPCVPGALRFRTPWTWIYGSPSGRTKILFPGLLNLASGSRAGFYENAVGA